MAKKEYTKPHLIARGNILALTRGTGFTAGDTGFTTKVGSGGAS